MAVEVLSEIAHDPPVPSSTLVFANGGFLFGGIDASFDAKPVQKAFNASSGPSTSAPSSSRSSPIHRDGPAGKRPNGPAEWSKYCHDADLRLEDHALGLPKWNIPADASTEAKGEKHDHGLSVEIQARSFVVHPERRSQRIISDADLESHALAGEVEVHTDPQAGRVKPRAEADPGCRVGG
jgi:hypothetical protein